MKNIISGNYISTRNKMLNNISEGEFQGNTLRFQVMVIDTVLQIIIKNTHTFFCPGN